MTFINITEGGISKIGAIDKSGIISLWKVMENVDITNTDYDLNVTDGSKFRMMPIYSDKLYEYPDVFDLFDEKSL